MLKSIYLTQGLCSSLLLKFVSLMDLLKRHFCMIDIIEHWGQCILNNMDDIMYIDDHFLSLNSASIQQDKQ